jgi:hypothetical protein
MACNKSHVFSRLAHVLLRRLKCMRADDIIMTCKPCKLVIQYRATVQRHATNCSRVWLAEAMTRQDGATLLTTHHVSRPTRPGVPTLLKTSLLLLAIRAILHRILSTPGPPVGIGSHCNLPVP